MTFAPSGFTSLLLATCLIAAPVLGIILLGITQRTPKPVVALSAFVYLGHLVVGSVLPLFLDVTQSDFSTYHPAARQLAEYWAGESVGGPELSESKAGWVWLLALTYWLGGPWGYFGILINSAFLGFIPAVTYATCRRLGLTNRQGLVGAILVSASPAQWFWGTLPLREAAITFILACVLYFTTRAFKDFDLSAWIGLALSLVSLLVFRGSFAIIIAAALLGAFCINAATGTARRQLLLASPLILASIASLAQYALSMAGDDLDVERISQVRSSQAGGATTSFGQGAPVSGAGETLVASLVTLPRVLMGPFPWELSGALGFLLPEVFYWWALLALAARGTKQVGFAHGSLLLLPFIGIAIALSVYSGNYGTMVRIRATAVVVLAPLAAHAFAGIRTRYRDLKTSDKSPRPSSLQP